MLHRLELAHRIQNRVHRCLHADRNRDGRHHILKIVAAEQLEFIRADQFRLFALFLAADDTVLQVIAVLKELRAREKDHLRLQVLPLSEGAQHLVVVIQHNKIIRSLVGTDVLLDANVVLHAVMAVQVIRRDIRNRRDMRAEVNDGLKLEARCLEHRDRLLRGL